MNSPLLLRLCPLAVVLALGGCVSKTPDLYPLPLEMAEEREKSFRAFVDQSCPVAVDADISLRYEVMGKELSWPGTLQMQDDRLVYRATDPLGRPLFMVSTGDAGFTLVDNQEARAHVGEWDCSLRQEYLPGKITPHDLVLWLSGRLEPVDMQLQRGALGPDGDCCWFVVNYDDGMDHYVRMDSTISHISRHLIYDPLEDELELEIDYDAYPSDGGSCPLPGEIVIKGRKLKGEGVITLERVYSREPLADKVFRVVLPEYFQVEEIE